MTDHELETFAASLRQIKPGRLPEEFHERLRSVPWQPVVPPIAHRQPIAVTANFGWLWRSLIPATAAIIIAVVWLGRQSSNSTRSPQTPPLASTAPSLEVDTVEWSQELLSSFDAVATLPSGEPVRFRCQQWQNKLTLDDQKQGLLVENWSPQIVVVPVRFESY